MEKRVAALEAVICSGEPEPVMELSYAALTCDEQTELYLLLDRLKEHQRFWSPGPSLTTVEETRMHALVDRGVLVPLGTRIDPRRR